MATTNNPYPTADTPPQYSGGNADNSMRSTSSDTVSRVAQGAHEAVDRIAEKAGPAIERVRNSMSGVTETMRAKAGELSTMEEQWLDSCRSTVRDHPLATVAVALAAGVLLSKMLSSSSR